MKAYLTSVRTSSGLMMKISATGLGNPSKGDSSGRVASPKARARRASPRQVKALHHVASSVHTGSEAEKARSPGRQTVQLLIRRTSPKKKSKKKKKQPRMMRCLKRRRRNVRIQRKRVRLNRLPQQHTKLKELMSRALHTAQWSYQHIWLLEITNGALKALKTQMALMILDTGCTKAMCSRHAFYYVKHSLSNGQVTRVDLLPDPSTFNFANGQQALAREKCRIWFSYDPPLFADFSIIDEGKVPFLMALPQMKNLGVSLDLRGTPDEDHIPHSFPERTRSSSSSKSPRTSDTECQGYWRDSQSIGSTSTGEAPQTSGKESGCMFTLASRSGLWLIWLSSLSSLLAG